MLVADPGKFQISPAARQRRKVFQNIAEEECETDAFTLAVLADEIHPVVPISAANQRKAVLAVSQTVSDGAHTMFVKCGALAGLMRRVVIAFFVRAQYASLKKSDLLIEDACVGDGLNITTRRVWQPKVVIREMRPHAAVSRRMPPM